ncbi:hypothetical protein A0O34_04630 [Chryseobacterium glaciei]|uniref:Uncharacterized protein n=1 Tax=Chryseobacterium glaciei TaxID=1685010 RepID=A0A172XSG8_9FLAO|nr:hypothetical protein [Chryseobacterium glaciei]ANF49866.1 hypothetical protein A0O34_04630 [Chryseobacterium glaciei]
MIKEKSFIKNSILIFFILFSNLAACQDSQLIKIDKLLKKAQKNHTEYRDFEELKLAKEANILAEKTNNSKLISESSYVLARALCSLELQKESLYYIEKASKQKFTKQTPVLQAKLNELKSYNYYVLSLKSQGSAELYKILELLKGNNDSPSIKIISRTYDNIANHYFDENKIDSAFIYYRLSAKELERLPVSKFHNAFCEHYISLGNAFLKKENADSTLYYFKKSYELKLKYKDPILFTQYMVFGSYYENQKQYEKALELYLKAIENMKEYSVNQIPFNYINKKISDLYGILDNKKKQDEFAEIYSKKENQLSLEKSRNVDYALNIILIDKKNEYNSAQEKKYAWIFIGTSIFIIISLYVYILMRKNLKYKESAISEFTNTLQRKEEIISKKNVEAEELQQKVNNAYTEIIELAKNNSPSFYFRFLEVYPEFQKKLLEYSQNLRTTELILCAYTFLGFTTKDIAEYTFKSVNTIRNRKQNLRKKFSIQTEEDMGIWLRNLISEKL